MRLKAETRILGIDDGSFFKGDKDTLVIGVVYRGGYWIDGLVSTKVEVDGMDATQRLIEMVSNCKYKDLRVIMLSGITLGGFNVVDICELSKRTGLPVIVVIEKLPDLEKVWSAVRNVYDPELRIEYMNKAGEVFKAKEGVYFQISGIDRDTAQRLILKTCTHSQIPEPVRVSHLIASGISRGESSKR